jgi:hypothetical protein
MSYMGYHLESNHLPAIKCYGLELSHFTSVHGSLAWITHMFLP